MNAVRLLVLVSLLAPIPARAGDPPAPAPKPAPPAPATLTLVALPARVRVEIDGTPVPSPRAPIRLAPGTYVLTVLPHAAPPFEVYLELHPGDRRSVTYVPRTPPDRPRPPEPAYGRALMGAGVVAGLAAATWWLLAGQSDAAAARTEGRTDLDATSRAAILADLADRAGVRRMVAIGTGVAASALFVTGVVLWKVLGHRPAVLPVVRGGPGGFTAGIEVHTP